MIVVKVIPTVSYRDGLIYRKFEPKGVMQGNAVIQLVVPQAYRKWVMKIAPHEGLMGGHIKEVRKLAIKYCRISIGQK